MSASQRVSRGFHRLIFSFVTISLLISTAAVSQTKRPAPLYVDRIDRGKGEVFITYSYAAREPPAPQEVLD